MKKLNIAFEDKNILVVNKPSGILTIATDKEKEKTLYHEVYNYLHKKNQKVFVVHRLDKDTSGIVVFSKSERVKESLQNTWEYIERNYIAVVHGFVVFAKNEKAKLRFQSTWDKVIRKYYGVVIGKIEESNKVINYMYEGKDLKTYITNDKNKGKKCITEYTPVKNTNKYTLLDINIKTGRKNQIRVTLSSLGHPLIGDKKYGATKNPIGRLGLHNYYLKFTHPITNVKIELTTKVPKEFAEIFETKKISS